jgi:hypothetical protein
VKKLLLIGTALLLTATSAQAEQMPPRARTMECAQEFVHRFYPLNSPQLLKMMKERGCTESGCPRPIPRRYVVQGRKWCAEQGR